MLPEVSQRPQVVEAAYDQIWMQHEVVRLREEAVAHGQIWMQRGALCPQEVVPLQGGVRLRARRR